MSDFDMLGVQHRSWRIIQDCDCGGEIYGRSDQETAGCLFCGKTMPWVELVGEFAAAEAKARETGIPVPPTRMARMLFG